MVGGMCYSRGVKFTSPSMRALKLNMTEHSNTLQDVLY